MPNKLRFNHFIFDVSFLVAQHLAFGGKCPSASVTGKVFDLQMHMVDMTLQVFRPREKFSTIFTTVGFYSQVTSVGVEFKTVSVYELHRTKGAGVVTLFGVMPLYVSI